MCCPINGAAVASPFGADNNNNSTKHYVNMNRLSLLQHNPPSSTTKLYVQPAIGENRDQRHSSARTFR